MTKGHNIKPSSLILRFWLNGSGSQLQSVQSSKNLVHKGQVLSVCNTQTELYTTVSVLGQSTVFLPIVCPRRFPVRLSNHHQEKQQQKGVSQPALLLNGVIVVRRFAYANDIVSCTNGSVATGRASLIGQTNSPAGLEARKWQTQW